MDDSVNGLSNAKRQWTEREADEDADWARRRIAALIQQIRLFEGLGESGPNAVVPRSPLSGDDASVARYKVSITAWTPLLVAIDHVALIASVLEHHSELPSLAVYTLIRPAIESAAWSIWVLEPAARDERVTRALQLRWLDEKDSGRVATARGLDPDISRDALRQHLKEIAGRRAALDPTRVDHSVSSTEVLKVANAFVDDGRLEGLLGWGVFSGLSHGRPHGILALTQRDVAEVSESGARTLIVRSSLVALSEGLHIAVRYIDASLGPWAQRNTAP